MSNDIVARLRNGYALDYDQNELFKFCNEAADEIERVRERRADWRAAMTENHDLWREVERLRAALRTIGYGPPDEGDKLQLLNMFVETARAALEGEKTDV
jgi:hypothetical protein